jgi:hypothetical protein
MLLCGTAAIALVQRMMCLYLLLALCRYHRPETRLYLLLPFFILSHGGLNLNLPVGCSCRAACIVPLGCRARVKALYLQC